MDLIVKNAGELVSSKVAELGQFQQFARVYTCTDDEAEEAGHEALGAIKTLLAQADDERKSLVEPVKKVTSAVDALYRDQIAKPGEAVKQAIESALRNYATEKLRKKREAEAAERRRLEQAQAEQQRLEREAEQAAKAGDVEVAQDLAAQSEQAVQLVQQARVSVVEVSRPVVVGTSNAVGGYKTRRVATITDPAKVPDVYWRPDLDMIQKAVDQGAQEIPGVVISEEIIVSNRRK